MTDSSDAVRRLVAEKIAEKSLSMSDLSKGIGKNQTYIQQYIKKGSPLWLPEEVRPALAQLLGVPEDALRRPAKGGGVKPVLKSFPPAVAESSHAAIASIEGRLRVLGMAECGPDGWSLWNGETVDYCVRPPNLAGAKDAYAVYAVGGSMEPRYHPGELVYIHPGKPPTPGSYVLVQMVPKADGDAPRAVLKRLKRRSGTKVVLEQFTPAKVFTIMADEIVSMHRVVGSGEA